MQGAGNPETPYIPETWEEFLSVIKKAGCYVKLPDSGGVYDLNTIYPDGGAYIEINASFIDGNNWEIRNAYNSHWSTETFNDKTIDNLHILDLYQDNGSDYDYIIYNRYITFNNCKFSGIISGNNRCLFGHDSYGLNRCSVNVKFSGNSHQLNSNSMNYQFCNIRIDHTGSTADNNSSKSAMKCTNSFLEHHTNESGYVLSATGYSDIIHSDAGSYILNSDGTKINVTEEQLRDSEYLSSVGFPII